MRFAVVIVSPSTSGIPKASVDRRWVFTRLGIVRSREESAKSPSHRHHLKRRILDCDEARPA